MKTMKKMQSSLGRGAKLSLMAVGVVAMLTGGIGVTSAWHHIPGVTEPFDPPNYYNPLTVSIPDSAPSPFALRDLAAQGGHVYDMTRDIKSVLYGEKFLNILTTIVEKLGIAKIDHQSVSSDLLAEGTDHTKEMQDRANEIAQIEEWKRVEASPLFHGFDEKEEKYNAPRDTMAQRRVLADAYTSYAKGAQLAVSDHAESDAVMQKLLDALAHAKGEMEIRQIGAQIEALSAAEDAKRTALLAALTELKATKQREETDRAMEHQRQVERSKVIVADPFDKEAVKASGYERRKPLGFVPFE